MSPEGEGETARLRAQYQREMAEIRDRQAGEIAGLRRAQKAERQGLIDWYEAAVRAVQAEARVAGRATGESTDGAAGDR